MTTLTLPNELISYTPRYPVLVSTYEQQSEQRKLISSKAVKDFKIQSPLLTKAQMQEWLAFYDGQNGDLTQFDFVSPFEGDNDVTLNVRFNSALDVRHTGALHTVIAELLVVNQDES